MNDVALDPFALSMDDPNLCIPPLLAFLKIIFQQRRNLPRKEGMKVNPVFDRNADNHGKNLG
jgi:hypothetical protein